MSTKTKANRKEKYNTVLLQEKAEVNQLKNNTRHTGIYLIGNAVWGTHFCQFYSTKQDLIDILVPYFMQGLADNEFCMWITSEPLGVTEVIAALRAAEPRLEEYISEGRIEILDYTEWYTHTGKFDAEKVLQGWVSKLKDAQKRGYDGLRISGNSFWLEHKDWEDFTAYEEIINRIISNYNMLAICTYSLDKCSALDIMDVISNHQFALAKRYGRWQIIENCEHRIAEAALRQSREDMARAQEVAQIGSWRLDVRNDVLTWSDENHHIFSIPKGTAMTYETFLGTVHPEDREYVDTQWKAGLAGKPYDIEHRIVADGQVKWVREKAYLEYDNKGMLVGGFGITQDITSRKNAQENLRILNETLEQRVKERTELAESRAKQLQALTVELIEAEERERRRFAELLHDDLQQIMAAAKMQLEAACRRLPDEPALGNVKQLLEESINKSRRLSHEISPAVMHHSGIVPALEWLARQMNEQFGLHVDIEAIESEQFKNIPLKMFLFRAVQELLFNTVKHSGVKSARIVLSVSDSSLIITVSDQGKGFNPAILDNTNTAAGFGLFSLRERAHYIGCGFAINSSPGRGSSFTLAIPLNMIKDGDRRKKTASIKHINTSENEGKAAMGIIRIMFADDHEVIREGIISLVSGQPDILVVGEASNGYEAVEKARQLKPDIIVIDVSMPEMDGIEATQIIKAEQPGVRVIGLSIYDDEQLAQRICQAGAETLISKNASSAELLKAIYGLKQ